MCDSTGHFCGCCCCGLVGSTMCWEISCTVSVHWGYVRARWHNIQKVFESGYVLVHLASAAYFECASVSEANTVARISIYKTTAHFCSLEIPMLLACTCICVSNFYWVNLPPWVSLVFMRLASNVLSISADCGWKERDRASDQ